LFAAVDIGASAGRVMAGTVRDGAIRLEQVHRFPNSAVEREGHLRWDIEALYREVRAGLAKVPAAESVGIDTWGVDYGLLDGDGQLLTQPVAYRDGRTASVIDSVHDLVGPAELFELNGLQFLPFNTIYQFAAEQLGPLWSRAEYAVLIPDLIAYRLTGELRSEVTNASTTGLLDVHTRQWCGPLLNRLGVPAGLLPPIEQPGRLRGVTASGARVITVGSHDTASAVVGVPATTERFAYISSGTWSLVGLELAGPVLGEDARRANFTNEVGVDGRTRFLRNVGGLWLLQECLREWGDPELEPLLEAAAGLGPGGPLIDVDDPAFIPPGRMPSRIAAAAGRDDLGPPAIVRCVLDSLAGFFARNLGQASALTGADFDIIHIVGGGSQNRPLCQLTSDAAGLPVVAGPVEATALGNVAVQARAAGALADSLEEMRSVIAASSPLVRYEPR
jgi:rhamnulokinase